MTNLVPQPPRPRVMEPMLTIRETAAMLQLSTDAVYALCHSRQDGFPAMRIGRQWRVSPTKLQQWIDRQSETPDTDDDVRL